MWCGAVVWCVKVWGVVGCGGVVVCKGVVYCDGVDGAGWDRVGWVVAWCDMYVYVKHTGASP